MTGCTMKGQGKGAKGEKAAEGRVMVMIIVHISWDLPCLTFYNQYRLNYGLHKYLVLICIVSMIRYDQWAACNVQCAVCSAVQRRAAVKKDCGGKTEGRWQRDLVRMIERRN